MDTVSQLAELVLERKHDGFQLGYGFVAEQPSQEICALSACDRREAHDEHQKHQPEDGEYDQCSAALDEPFRLRRT